MEANKHVGPLLIGVIAVVALGVGIMGGTWYQRSQFASVGRFGGQMDAPRMSFENRMGQKGRQMMGRGALSGEVTAKDDKSVTINLNDGSSRTFLLNTETTYSESKYVKAEDITVGSKVAVFGDTTATSIELNPALRGQLGR